MKPILYVDGYNVIGAWSEAIRNEWPLDECRDRLVHAMEDYAGYTGQEVYLVFDGYKAERLSRSVESRRDVTVVYTKHGETADHFIERMCQQLPKYREARVATSDGVEQTIIMGRGATRLSSRELLNEMRLARGGGRDRHQSARQGGNTLSASLSAEQYAALEELRRQR